MAAQAAAQREGSIPGSETRVLLLIAAFLCRPRRRWWRGLRRSWRV